MKNSKWLLILIFVATFSTLSAQGKGKIPEYLTTQELPDSVKNTVLFSLDGSKTNLAKVLQKHKGKKILVDVWASWCKDCIVGLPKYNRLKEKLKNKKVVYLFLSVDTDKNKWKKAIEKFNIKAEHYQIPAGWKNPFTNYINLDWIPRYLVFDENGKIVFPKATEADDPRLFEFIN